MPLVVTRLGSFIDTAADITLILYLKCPDGGG